MSTIRVNNMTAVGGLLPTYALGHVVQMVTATTQTAVNTTGTSYVDSGLSAVITPKTVNSKILVLVNGSYNLTPGGYYGMISVFRGTVAGGLDLGASNTNGLALLYSSAAQLTTSVGINIVDSPASTGAVTYSVGIKNNTSGSTINAQHAGTKNSITLLEVAA